MSKRQFGELEAKILSLFNQHNKLTVKQVHQLFGEKDNYNTIMTVMYRLSQKKILMRSKVKLSYEYWLPPQKQTPNTFFQQIKQKIAGIRTQKLVSYLIESDQEMNEEELLEIERLIQKAKEQKKCSST